MSEDGKPTTWAEVQGAMWKQAIGIIGAGIVGFGSLAGAFYVQVTSTIERYEEVHHRLERDVESLQADRREDRDDFDDLVGDVRALKAAYEAGQADTRARLIRIESALDGRRR